MNATSSTPRKDVLLNSGFNLRKGAWLPRGFTLRGAWPRSGFTLIELLVVIAIIGLLSTLAIVALGSARQKSRDARRLADIKQIQTAIEMYNNENGSYPVATSTILLGDSAHACLGFDGFNTAGACTGQYLNFPRDPSGGYYTFNGTGIDYLVSATLEGSVNDLSGAIAAQPNVGILNSYNSNYGLVGWWKFDDASGTTTADSSGNGNTGIWNGTGSHWTTGKIGGAGQFNGSDYVQVDTSASFSLSGLEETVILWAKHASSYFLYQSSVERGRRFYGTYVHLYNNLGTTHNLNLGPVNDNQWHQLAYTFKDRTAKSFADGELVEIETFPSDLYHAATGFWWFGRLCAGGGAEACNYWYTGLLDDIRIYNRALSDAEIKSLYDSQK